MYVFAGLMYIACGINRGVNMDVLMVSDKITRQIDIDAASEIGD